MFYYIWVAKLWPNINHSKVRYSVFKNHFLSTYVAASAFRSETESHVIGGTPVSPPNKWPWVVAVKFNGVYQCGGALITPLHVLTSAYCVDIWP